MTLRERIADWLTGGKYTHAVWMKNRFELTSDHAWKLEEALRAIAAMETPKANATVRRMAKLAREAVG